MGPPAANGAYCGRSFGLTSCWGFRGVSTGGWLGPARPGVSLAWNSACDVGRWPDDPCLNRHWNGCCRCSPSGATTWFASDASSWRSWRTWLRTWVTEEWLASRPAPIRSTYMATPATPRSPSYSTSSTSWLPAVRDAGTPLQCRWKLAVCPGPDGQAQSRRALAQAGARRGVTDWQSGRSYPAAGGLEHQNDSPSGNARRRQIGGTTAGTALAAASIPILQKNENGDTKVRRGEDWHRAGHNSTIKAHDMPTHRFVEDHIDIIRHSAGRGAGWSVAGATSPTRISAVAGEAPGALWDLPGGAEHSANAREGGQ